MFFLSKNHLELIKIYSYLDVVTTFWEFLGSSRFHHQHSDKAEFHLFSKALIGLNIDIDPVQRLLSQDIRTSFRETWDSVNVLNYLTYNNSSSSSCVQSVYQQSCLVHSFDPSNQCIQLPPLWHSFVEKQSPLMPVWWSFCLGWTQVPSMGTDKKSYHQDLYKTPIITRVPHFFRIQNAVRYPL